ncbi:MAG: exodeoxyribonuclease VII large subunit, partial [Usitatibacter sp.]
RRLLTPAEKLARDRERLVQYARRLRRAAPDVTMLRRDVERLAERLSAGLARGMDQRERRLAASRMALGHLDPTQVLARGYSIVRDADGRVRVSSAGLAAGETLDVTFSEGGAVVKVRETR